MKFLQSALAIPLLASLPLLAQASTNAGQRLNNRQACPTSQSQCGNLCIDATYSCCPGETVICLPGQYCVLAENNEYGCCNDGDVCTGDASGPTTATDLSSATGTATDSSNTVTETSAATSGSASTTTMSPAATATSRTNSASTISASASSSSSQGSSTSGAAAPAHLSGIYSMLAITGTAASVIVFGLMILL